MGQLPIAEAWHASSGTSVVEKLGASSEGLSATAAAERLRRYGPNALPAAAQGSALRRFLNQFNNVMIYFLLIAGAAAALLGHVVDAVVIITVVVANATIGFIQEGRAQEALNAIRALIAPEATVIRDHRRQHKPVDELVPGDLVLIEAGDRVPADIRLLRARRLLIDEALLTGESLAAEKHDAPVALECPLGDRSCMAYSGTLVAAGQGTGIVVETGQRTEIGRISSLLQGVESLSTPLLRQMDAFARRFTWLVLGGGTLLFAFAVLVRAYDWVDALIAVVALAVGIVPEGLPAVISITLAIGVGRMAARNAVIRRLPAVETLGATSVICTDKTGTLTRNEMTARHVFVHQREFLVSGSGYAPEGELTARHSDGDISAAAACAEVLRCGLLCNDADLWQSDGQWAVNGDPMEGALISLAMKAGHDPARTRAEWPRLDEIPFDATHRFMATLHAGPQGERVVFIKGAADAILPRSRNETDRIYWDGRIDAAGAEGERVLGFAMKRHARPDVTLRMDDVEQDIEFLGLIGFIDPPRPEAKLAIAECRSAQIAVKMITGDHAATAAAIARQLDIADVLRVTTGAQIDQMSDAELQEAAEASSVFARTSPENKLRIVQALQARGHVVAMTGDGVNDAPSLKQANVGTAMGIKGTEAAKEAAEMVLLDDNFASIVSAVREGRTVHDNIKKVIAWELPANGGETLAVVVAILIGFSLPMSATQILWINLVLTATLGLVLAFEPPEPGVMQRPPRPARAPLLSPFLVWRIFSVSILLGATMLGIFFYALQSGRDLETARTMVVNAVAVSEIFYLFTVRHLYATSFTWRGVLGTRPVLIAIAVLAAAQILFTYAPFMNEIFESRPLTLAEGVLILFVGVGLMVVLELEKALMRRTGWFSELRR
ncbi:carbonate dehydratase [Rhizomicrobium sp. SCGC AG-212-E05]|nr:carbonate dehydratase [Rhizomicrobium sp. SCGC AG-212-E05]